MPFQNNPKRIIPFVRIGACVAMVVETCSAFVATLNIGDPAPKLDVSKWAQGDPVFEIGKSGAR